MLDGSGRHWTRAQFDAPPLQEQGAMLTLVYNSNNHIEVIGNAFVIHDQGAAAICMTAAHCFEEVKRQQRIGRLVHHATVPDVLRPRVTEYIKSDSIGAILRTSDGQIHVCTVGQLNYIGNFDVAVFVAQSADGKKIFSGRLAIDLAVPEIGEQIAVLGHRLTAEHQDCEKAIIGCETQLNLGTVTDVKMGLGRMGQGYYFETTVPIEPGFSGSPVVKRPEPGKAIIVCGVASSDISSPEAFKDFFIAGNSTASMLWPAMGLFLPCATVDAPVPALHLIGELLERGNFDNRTMRARVSVRGNSEQIDIAYVDDERDPPLRYWLTTPGMAML